MLLEYFSIQVLSGLMPATLVVGLTLQHSSAQVTILVVLNVVHKVPPTIASRISQRQRIASNIYPAKDAAAE